MRDFLQSYKKPLDILFNILKKNKFALIVLLVAPNISSIVGIILPYIAKLEIDQLSHQNQQLFWIIFGTPFTIFAWIIALSVLFTLITDFLRDLFDTLSHKYTEKIRKDVRLASYERLWHVELWTLLNKRNRELLPELLDSWSDALDSINTFLTYTISSIISFAGILFVFSLINIYIWIIVVFSVIIWHTIIYFAKKLGLGLSMAEKYNSWYRLRRLTHEVSFSFDKIVSSWGFNDILNHVKKWFDQEQEYIVMKGKNDFKMKLLDNINTLLLSTLLVKLFVWYNILDGVESIWLMAMTTMYVSTLQGNLSNILSIRFDRRQLIDGIQKFSIFLEYSTIKKTFQSLDVSAKLKIAVNIKKFSYPSVSQHEVSFYNVVKKRLESYGYKSNRIESNLYIINQALSEVGKVNPTILSNINLEFEEGKIYGIVWKNGAGKSTLINLLLNYFSSYEGMILYNETLAKDLPNEFFYEQVGFIGQEPYFVYGLTIIQNILLGSAKEYSEDEIYDLLKTFWLDSIIRKMKKGLHTEVGYDTDLSWGQKQLLVLCRLILQDKKVLIFDEWTNQLDAENELLVMKKLLENRKDKIVLFITHRMTTIRKADFIICLQNWTIQTVGTHQSLLWKDNIYNTFWQTQTQEEF